MRDEKVNSEGTDDPSQVDVRMLRTSIKVCPQNKPCQKHDNRTQACTTARLDAQSADDAALPTTAIVLSLRSDTASPSMMASCWYALTHQHAGTGGSLKDIVNAFDFEGGAFLVATGADGLGDTFTLSTGDELVEIGCVGWWTQIGLAADEEYWNRGAADGAYFFYPLSAQMRLSIMSREERRSGDRP